MRQNNSQFLDEQYLDDQYFEQYDGFDEPYVWLRPEPSVPPTDELIDEAIQEWIILATAPCTRPRPDLRRLLLNKGLPWRTAVDRRVTGRLTAELRACWQRGWLPLDLHRAVPELPRGGSVLSDAMAADLATYATTTVDRRFFEQLRDLKAGIWWPANQSWLAARAGQPGQDWDALLSSVIAVVVALRRLRSIPQICLPPGEAAPVAAPAQTQVDDKILERVRQLLAKAESTSFEAEAETFTAGAQSLMARHSIDAAMLARGSKKSSGPASTRIYVDAPYEAAKVDLLTAIADANRCRAVWFKELKFVSVVGFETDLVAVETLFTSLLVQATASMQRHGSRKDRYGRSRTRSFRSSFLTAFAHKIGERLVKAADDEVVRAAGRSAGSQLLPVLAAREQQVDAAFAELFPNIRLKETKFVRDAEGWHAGTTAADQAALKYGEALP